MESLSLKKIYQEIVNDEMNSGYKKSGYKPLYSVSEKSKIILIGQAPGIKAQESGIIWHDISGDRFRSWLGVSEEEFYNNELFGIMPMDFFFPGSGPTGDLPPRKEFTKKYHPLLLKEMKNVQLIVLVGKYALDFYLHDKKKNTTQIIADYQSYLPKYFPLVHPSPRNFRWHKKNPWFLKEVVPSLQKEVRKILSSSIKE